MAKKFHYFKKILIRVGLIGLIFPLLLVIGLTKWSQKLFYLIKGEKSVKSVQADVSCWTGGGGDGGGGGDCGGDCGGCQGGQEGCEGGDCGPDCGGGDCGCDGTF